MPSPLAPATREVSPSNKGGRRPSVDEASPAPNGAPLRYNGSLSYSGRAEPPLPAPQPSSGSKAAPGDSPISSSSSPRGSVVRSARETHAPTNGNGPRKRPGFHTPSLGNFLTIGGPAASTGTGAVPGSHAFHRTLSNSLTWPSRHRSHSSTTRDSSRRSDGGMPSGGARIGPGSGGGMTVYPPLSPFALSHQPVHPLVDDLDLVSHEPATDEEVVFREECEEEARRMTTEQLREAVKELRTETRILKAEVTREREVVQELYEGVAHHLGNTEKQQEQTANKLMRYVQSLQRKKVRLQQHLKAVQAYKQEQERNLRDVQQSVVKLKAHLKTEEDVIAQRIQRKIIAMQEKRTALEKALRQETYSIQQLEGLVTEFQHLDAAECGVGARPPAPAPAPAPTANTTPRKSSLAVVPTPLQDETLQTSSVMSDQLIITSPPRGPNRNANNSESARSAEAGGLHSRSGSQMSASSSVTGITRNNPSAKASIRFLQKAIGVLEHLREDAEQQEALYSNKTAELQKRVEAEMQTKKEELLALQNIQREIAESRKQCGSGASALRPGESDVPAGIGPGAGVGRGVPAVMTPLRHSNPRPRGAVGPGPTVGGMIGLARRGGGGVGSHVSRSVASTGSYCDTLDGIAMGVPDLLPGVPHSPGDDETSLVTPTETSSSLVSHPTGPAAEHNTGHVAT